MKEVSILLATYDPNLDWFKAQLVSLNSQSYKNLKLFILDDFSPNVDFADITDMIKKTITSFKYEIYRNETNLGSCKTFERLTDLSDGDYFSYCDQDDVWEFDKIEKMMAQMDEDTNLMYADLCIIDENGKKTNDSLRDIRKRLVHRHGHGLAKIMLFRPFITGCTMIVKADIAKQSIPFINEMIGDHHISLYAASKGKIAYLDEPLVRYRQHGNNVTGIMKGVNCKSDYVTVRILPLISQFNKLKLTYQNDKDVLKHIDNGLKWLYAREKYLNGKLLYGAVIKWYSRYNFKTSLFDLTIPFMPKKFFEKMIQRIKGASS